MGFQNEEILKILPKFAGILATLRREKMEQIQNVLAQFLDIKSNLILKEIYIKSPTLLTQEEKPLKARLFFAFLFQIFQKYLFC